MKSATTATRNIKNYCRLNVLDDESISSAGLTVCLFGTAEGLLQRTSILQISEIC
ncbi:MAG: hypothetical protein AAFN08_05810 [Cyanobacteria bacterium J06559_3]